MAQQKNSILEYSKRLGKSIALSAFEVLKEQAPATTNLISSNAQTVRDGMKQLLDTKGMADKVAEGLKVNYLIKSAKTAVKNIKEDIKTGNFQNEARKEQAEQEAMGMLMQGMLGDIFDMTEGDLNPDEMSEEEQREYPVRGIPEVTKGDVVVSTVVGMETRRATNAITDTLARISEADNANRQSIASIQISQNERQALLLNNGFTSMIGGLNSLIEFNNSVLRVHAENTKVYQETMMNTVAENNAILKEMVEMQRQVYKSTNKPIKEGEEGEDEEGKSKDPTDFFSNVFDLKKYGSYVKQNIKDNPFYFMVNTMLDSIPMMIQEAVANPMNFLTKKAFEWYLGNAKTALNRLDDSIQNGIQTLLAKIFDYGHSGKAGTITGALARIFGFKQGEKSFASVDASKYNRGAMSWNGIAQKALVEIIPGHLRKIEASLTGQGERLFDYRSGKWTTAKSAKLYESKIDRNNVNVATDQLKTALTDLLSPYAKDMAKEDRRALNNELTKFLTGIYKRGYVDPDNIVESPNRYGSNERLTQLFLRLLANVDRGVITRLPSKITKAKRSKNALVENMNFEDQGIQNELISGALNNVIVRTGEKAGVTGSGLTLSSPLAAKLNTTLVDLKDNRGLTLYDYQSMIYKELRMIRNIYTSGSGIITPNQPISNGVNIPGSNNVIVLSQLGKNDLPPIQTPENSRRKQLEELLNDPKFKSSTAKREDGKTVKERVQERIKNYWNTKVGRRVNYNDFDMEETFDLEKFLNDDEYANSILQGIDKNGQKIQEKYDLLKDKKTKVVKDEDGNVIEDDRSFVDRLLEAKSLGDKFEVLSDGFKGFVNAPSKLLTTIVATADKYIFDFLYSKDTNTKDKNNKEVHGFFNKILYEAEKLFDNVNEKINGWFKSIKEGDFLSKAKKWIKDLTGFDIDDKLDKVKSRVQKTVAPIGDIVKSTIKNNFAEVKNAVLGTMEDVGLKNKESKEEKKTEENKQETTSNTGNKVVEALKNVSAMAFAGGSSGGDMSAYASGARNVKRGGLAFISEGEAIIPADINPWNSNRESVDRKEQSKNESRMKQRFMNKLDSSVRKYAKDIPQHADGIGSFGSYMSREDMINLLYTAMQDDIKSGKVNEKQFIKMLWDKFGIAAFNNIFNEPNTKVLSDDEIKAKTQGIGKDKLMDALNDYSANQDKYYRQKKIKEKEEDYRNSTGPFTGINQFLLSAFGKDIDLAVEDVNDYVVKNSPELVGGGLTGGLLSLVLPLGGPLMGAIAGAAASILAHNKSFTNYIFGSEMTDPKTGKVITQEGVIPRKIVNSMKKYLPDIKKYGIVGGLAGLVLPFGPVGGVMIGTAASIIKNNQTINDILFGDENGFLNADRKKAIRKALPNIGGAVLGTLFLGPFGILGNAILGSGLGLLSTTESFKRIILGTKDRNGIRRGGLAGAIRRQITDPFKRSMEEIKDQLGPWFRDKILTPIGRGLLPIGKVATSVISSGINSMVSYFRDRVGGFFFDKLFNRFFGGVRGLGGIGKRIGQFAGRIAATGARQVERVGDRVKLWGLKHGYGENLSVQDRLETYGRNKMGHTLAAQLDRTMAGMNEKELEANRDMIETLNMVANGKFDYDIRRLQRGESASLETDISDLVNNSKGSIKYKDVDKYKDKLFNIKSDEDLENIIKAVDEDLDYLTPENRKKIKDVLVKSGTTIRKHQKMGEAVKDSNTLAKMKQQLKETYGIQGFSDEEIEKQLPTLLKYMNAQLDTKHKENKNKLRQMQEEQEKDENKSNEELTLDNLEQMSEFQKAQLEEQKLMNRNLRTLIDIALGGGSAKDLAGTKDINTLVDKANMDQAVRDAEAEKVHLNTIMKNQDEKTQQEVSELRTSIFGDKFGRGTEALENLSDEKLMYLLGTDKKKRNQSISYLRTVAKNYDSTLSKIINTDKFLDLSPQGMKRVTELTLRGYEVKPEDYKDIEELSKYGYKAIIELAKLGVKIDSYKAIDRYFEHHSTGTQKKKSLEALLDFAGVKLKDGRRIANVLTTSEIADNLEDDAVRGLRYNNEYNSYQIGINKAIEEGNIPENLKLQSSAATDTITSRKKSTDVGYNADEAVSDANLDATMAKTAQVVSDTLEGIYNKSESILKEALSISAKIAENSARTVVPGADTVLDAVKQYRDINHQIDYENEKNKDTEYRNAIEESRDKRNKEVSDLEARYKSGEDIETIAKDFLGIKDEEEKKEDNKQEEAKKTDVSTHANGLLSQLKDASIDAISNKIRGNNNNDSSNKAAEETTQSTQQAQTQPVENKLEEYNNLREGNSITQAGAAGFNLISNPLSGGNTGGGSITNQQGSDSQNVPTADGDTIQYSVDRQGNLVEKSNKNNTEIRQKQQYKLSLQERATRALEKMSGLGVAAGGKIVDTAKKAGGGLLDILKGIFGFPKEILSSIIGLVPFLGPLLSLGGSALSFLAKFLGGKLLDKVAGTALGATVGKLISKIRQTRIGDALADRFGLDIFEDKVNEASKTETGDTGSDTKTSTNENKNKNSDNTRTSDTLDDITETITENLPDGEEDNKKNDNKNESDSKRDTDTNDNNRRDTRDNRNSNNRKKGFFSKIKDNLSNLKDKVSGSSVKKGASSFLGYLRKNKRTAIPAAAIATIAGLEMTNYGTFTGEGLTKNLEYATGLETHAFDASKYGLSLSAAEQIEADSFIRQGKSPEAVAELMRMKHEQSGVGGGDHDNLAQQGVDLATSPFTWAWEKGSEGAKYLVNNPLNNPITELALGHLVTKATGSTIKGASANTGLELLNKYRSGELDNQSLFDIISGTALDFGTNLAMEKGIDTVGSMIGNRLDWQDQQQADDERVNKEPEVDDSKVNNRNNNGDNNNPPDNNKRDTSEDERDNRPNRNTRVSLRNKLRNTARNIGTRAADIAKTAGGKIRDAKLGEKLKNGLKTKKGKFAAASLLATPFLLSMNNETDAAIPSTAAKLGEFQAKNTVASNVDEESLVMSTAEAAGVHNEEEPTEQQETESQEESGGLLDTIRNNPLISTAVSFIGATKGSDIGASLGEKLLGKRGKFIGELAGGTLGANILDPTEITPWSVLESYAIDKGFDFITGRNKDNEDNDEGGEPPNPDLPDSDRNNPPEPDNGNRRSLKDRIKDRYSRAKNYIKDKTGKIVDLGSRAKDYVVNRAGNIKDFVTGNIGTFKNRLSSLKDSVVNKVTGVKDKVLSIRNAIHDKASSIKDSIFDTASGLKNKALGLKDSLVDRVTSLKDKVVNTKDAIINKVGDIKDSVVNKASSIKDSIFDTASGLKNKALGLKTSITDGLVNAKDKVFDFGSSVKDKVVTTAQNMNATMKNATNAAIDVTKQGADEAVLKVQSLIGKVKEGIKACTSALGRWISGKGPLNAIKNFASMLMDRIIKPQNIKRAAAKLARSTLTAVVGATGIGLVAITIAGAVSDFIHGYNNADELYHLKPGLATTGMKIVAGYISALVGVIPFLNILIPEDLVLELAVEYIGPAFGFGKRELDELRKSGEDETKRQQNEVARTTTLGEDFQSMVKNATDGVISKVVKTADAAAASISDIGKNLANKVGESATVAKNWVSDTAKTVGDWITDKASRGWEYLKDKANDAKNTVSEIYNSASNTVKEKYESVKSTIKDYLPSFGSGKHSLYGMNKFYSQLDPKYAMKFNTMNDSITQSMSDSGCGPAALSNAMSSIGINVDPRLTAQYALENGYKETDGGTRPEFFTDMMNKLGTGSSRLNTQNDIVSNLKQGNPVILMGKDGRGESKQNPYAENPHYVTATGIDRRGNIIVQDPESFTPNKVYKASDVLNKSTVAIGAGRGKPRLNRLYGRSRSIINHVAHKIKSSIPRMYGRSRYGRGGDMGAQIYEYLHKKIGLSSIVTAGIMGNMMAESGLMPDRVQGDGIITAPEITVDGETGYGLCQWTYITRQQGLQDFAAQQGKSSSDYQVQCDYLMYELENSYPGTIQAMDQTGDVRQAALKFHDMYEGSADTPEMKERRADYAEQILANEGKGIVEAGTYSGSSGSSGTTGAKKNTGFFGAISNIASILSSALNPFGSGADTTTPTTVPSNNTTTTPTTDTKSQQTTQTEQQPTTTDTPTTTGQTATTPTTTETGKGKFSSRYGRFKHFVYGRGDEATTEGQATTTTTEPSTNTPNMDAQEVQQAQDANANTQNQNKPTTTKQSSSSGGFMSGLESFAKSFAAPLGKAMSKFGSVLKSGVTSVFGSKLSFLFGDDNPFLSIFGGGESSSSGNKPGQTGPGQTMNVKVAGNPVDTLLGSMPGAVMTSDYGATEGRPTAGAHGGVDIGADEGTPIPSPISGTVVDLGSGYGGGYGNYIQVKDAKGNFHMFAHCASQSVSIGQQVQPGTVLGTVGNTGQSYGAHLHYEIDPPENEGAVKGGPTLNPNSYTGAGKHLTSLGMGKLVLPKYGMGGFDTSLVDKSTDDLYDDITTLKPDTEIGEDIESANTLKEVPKPRNEVFEYDGFGVDKVPKYGTGWFSDFTKRSINTIKDAFSRWTKDWNEGEEAKPTETDSSTKSESANVVPSKQPSTTSKGQDIPVAPTTQETKTESKPQVSTSDQNTHTVTDTQKLDAILDAMNENNRLVKQQNQLLSSIINIASNYINSNVVRVDNKQQLTMNTNTRANNYDPTTLSVKAQLSQIGNGSQYGIGDRFGTRDADGFSEIIRTINEIATR